MTKTLFIGLDGATFTVLDRLTSDVPGQGVVMPYMKRLMERGVRAPLRSTPNPLTPPAWVSIMTGRTPGHHGVYDFLRAEEKGTDVYWTLSDSRDIRTEMIWSIASRQNRTVAALNFPLTAPPRKVSGSVVPGFIPWKHLRRNITPPELFDRLKASVPGFSPRELAWDFGREAQAMEVLSEQETHDWVEYHLPREEQWFRIAHALLTEDKPDLMAVMFDGTDKIQHQAWPFLDPEYADQDTSQWGESMRQLCRQYFRRLDGFIEKLVEAADPDAQVFMASDHGFTASTQIVRMNAFLHEKGYLYWRDPVAGSEETAGDSQRQGISWFAQLDWTRSTAYCRTPSSNGITIRVAARPGDPGVPSEEYESFREQLIADLTSLRDEDGRPVIKEIHKREDVFPGPAMEQAPDLQLVLEDYGFVSISNATPIVQRRSSPMGTHHPDGVFIAAGKGIRSAGMVETRHITDVTAAMLYSLGLPVPSDVEGRVPEPFFTQEHLRANPVTVGPPTLPVDKAEAQHEEMEDTEKEKIIAQLQMLGYME